MRGFLKVVGWLLLLGAVAVGGYLVATRSSNDEASPEETVVQPLSTVAVIRTDLTEDDVLEGRLEFRDSAVVVTQRTGVVTGLADEAAVVGRGEALAEIDGEPVVMMIGERPAWRPLAEGDEGTDVLQLEQNLASLGFDPDGELTVDGEYTSFTETVVEDWQESLGVEETGEVALGSVVFLPSEVRVGVHSLEVGASVAPGTPLFETSSTQQVVMVDLEADRQDLLDEGDEVTIDLPDGGETAGRVERVGRVVRTDPADPTAEPVVEVTIELLDSSVVAAIDQAPVDVTVVSVEASDVLAVPVEALLALGEGGYALEIDEGGAEPRRVGVEIGKFADGLVEVRGEVSEGDLVVVPG